jgi:hypothetical protein
MATRVLVIYHSVGGHVASLARAIRGVAESARNTEARLRRFPDDTGPVDSAAEAGVDEATVDDPPQRSLVGESTGRRLTARASGASLTPRSPQGSEG